MSSRFGLNPSSALRQSSTNVPTSMVPLVELHNTPGSVSASAQPTAATPAASATIPAQAGAPTPTPASRPIMIRIPTATSTSDKLAAPLATNPAFRAAVQSGDVSKAAAAAVKYIMEHYQNFLQSSANKPPAATATTSSSQPLSTSLPAGAPAEGTSPAKRNSEGEIINRPKRAVVDAAAKRGEEAHRHRDFSIGDKVVVVSSNKRLTSTDVIGTSAHVTKVEPNGWIVITFPDNRELRIQQRYLAHTSSPATTTTTAGAGGGSASGGEPMSLGPSAARPSSPLAINSEPSPPPISAGNAPPAPSLLHLPEVPDDLHSLLLDDDLLLDDHPPKASPIPPVAPPPPAPPPAPSSRPAPPDVQGPTKYSQHKTPMMVGRAVTKMREMVRVIRRELTSLEEKVPWGGVIPRWRVMRGGWLRGLKNTESVKDCAVAMKELHEALLTDKTQGLFEKGGVWERGLQECIDAKSGYQALQQLWSEMQEEVTAWMESGGTTWGGGNPPPAPDNSVHVAAAARAAAALEAAAQKGDTYLEQVPLTSILNHSKDSFQMLRGIVERERAKVLQQMETEPGAGRGGLDGPAAAQAGGDVFWGDYWADLLGTHSSDLDIKLQLGLVEVDTDLDEGSEATDMGEGEAAPDMMVF